ncbi:MAG: EAL domain-containing protein [Chloroflexota bacterium]|nr:EAL domain-containing protein [Chloroflexota bacterium]
MCQPLDSTGGPGALATSLGIGALQVVVQELVAEQVPRQGPARSLPAGRWLDLNVSPRLLDSSERLASLLRSADRPVVIEITEHERISDYAAVRDAAAALGEHVRLAVDDAGVGIANFGHIIELRPDLVKLDITLVRRVNADLGRQALVVAMRHFARTAGCRLVAEGIETEEEAHSLKLLGVEFGQGNWFGRPEPVERWSGGEAAAAS